MTDAPPAGAGVYGYRVESELTLPRLRRGPMPRGRVVVERSARELLDESAEIVQLTEYQDRPGVAFAIARTEGALLAWCAETGAYRIDAAHGRIWAHVSGGVDAWEDRLLNAVIPLLLVERGELMLHAAAVLTHAGALIVHGASGRGKSTLAAALGCHGAPVLAEDSVAVSLAPDGAALWPGPAGVRLDPATSTALGTHFTRAPLVRGKRMHVPATASQLGAPVPIAALIELEPRDGLALNITRVADVEAMMSLFPSVYRVEPESWSGAFSSTAELVRQVPCFKARLPNDLGNVDGAALELLERVTNDAESVVTAA